MKPNKHILLIVLVAVLAWAGVSSLLVPGLIEAMYQGELPGSRVFKGMGKNPLEYYLRKWVFLAVVVGVMLSVFGLALALPAIRGCFFQRDDWKPAEITMFRRMVFDAVALLIVFGAMFQILLGRDDYPFSSYRMYSGVHTSRAHTEVRLYGVDQEGREVHLREKRYLHPFAQDRLQVALSRMARSPEAQGPIDTTLKFLLVRYESRRQSGQHSGPQLVGIRLYELEWTVQSGASNRNAPERKVLLSEHLL